MSDNNSVCARVLWRFPCSRGLMTWMTRSSWTCCLSLRDWAKRRKCTGCCRTWGAGSRLSHSGRRRGASASPSAPSSSLLLEAGGLGASASPPAPLSSSLQSSPIPPGYAHHDINRLWTFNGHSNISLLKSAYDKPKNQLLFLSLFWNEISKS